MMNLGIIGDPSFGSPEGHPQPAPRDQLAGRFRFLRRACVVNWRTAHEDIGRRGIWLQLRYLSMPAEALHAPRWCIPAMTLGPESRARGSSRLCAGFNRPN